jgi:hypothetical protein
MSRPLFTMWPKRADELFRRDLITADEAWLLIRLVAEADFETRECVVTNIGSLRSQLGWDRRGQSRSRQHVSNCLAHLREIGEIAYDIGQGQRKPFVVRIGKSDYFQRTPAAGLDATSNDESGRRSPAPSSDAFRVPELPKLEVAVGQTRSEIEANIDQGREPALPDERTELAREKAAELLALLPPSVVEPNTHVVLTRYVRQMPQHQVNEAVASYRNALAHGEIRNPANYMVTVLRERAMETSR